MLLIGKSTYRARKDAIQNINTNNGIAVIFFIQDVATMNEYLLEASIYSLIFSEKLLSCIFFHTFYYSNEDK